MTGMQAEVEYIRRLKDQI